MREHKRRLSLRTVASIHLKVAIGAWAVAMLAFTPDVLDNTLGASLTLGLGVTVVGTILSVVGIVRSAHQGAHVQSGLRLELSGIFFSFAGPVVYGIVQVYLIFTSERGDQRVGLAFLAYVMCAALFSRLVVVWRRRAGIPAAGMIAVGTNPIPLPPLTEK